MVNEIVLIPVPLVDLLASVRDVVKQELAAMQPIGAYDKPAEYVSRKQVAALLNITLPTLGAYIRTGKIKAYRIGRRVRFKLSEVESSMKVIQVGLRTTIDNQPKNNTGVKNGV